MALRNYFKSLRFWYVDAVVCYIVAALVTPADPMSALMVFVPLLIVWLVVRLVVARRLSR